MNPQARGSVKLQSANVGDPPLVDPNYGGSAYDREVYIRAVRCAMQLVKTKHISQHWKKGINVPQSESDEDIWVRQYPVISCTHACSTPLL